jgi:hypothetical protein
MLYQMALNTTKPGLNAQATPSARSNPTAGFAFGVELHYRVKLDSDIYGW